MSCERNYGIAGYPICSGHADACVNNQCICERGWSGYADLQLREGYDCDINLQVVRIWCGINIGLATCASIYVIYHMYKSNLLSKQNRYSSRTICFLANLSVNIGGFVFAGAKFYDPVRFVLGRGFLTTFSGVAIMGGIATSKSAYIYTLIKFLKGYSRLLDSKRRKAFYDAAIILNYFIIIAPIAVALSLGLILLLCNLSNPYVSDNYSIAFFGFVVVDYSLYGIALEYILYTFNQEINIFVKQSRSSAKRLHDLEEKPNIALNRISSHTPFSQPIHHGILDTVRDLEIVKNKISVANQLFIPFFVVGIILNLLFLCWHFLRRKLSFLIAFQTSILHFICPIIVWSIKKISKVPTFSTSNKMHHSVVHSIKSIVSSISKRSSQSRRSGIISNQNSIFSANGKKVALFSLRPIHVAPIADQDDV